MTDSTRKKAFFEVTLFLLLRIAEMYSFINNFVCWRKRKWFSCIHYLGLFIVDGGLGLPEAPVCESSADLIVPDMFCKWYAVHLQINFVANALTPKSAKVVF